jgi:hypothetical protein
MLARRDIFLDAALEGELASAAASASRSFVALLYRSCRSAFVAVSMTCLSAAPRRFC